MPRIEDALVGELEQLLAYRVEQALRAALLKIGPPRGAHGVTIRAAGPAYEEQVLDLELRLIRYDMHFGGPVWRANTARLVRDEIRASLEVADLPAGLSVTGDGRSQDDVAHIFILIVSSLPDVLAVLLIIAAGYRQPRPVPVKRRRKPTPRRRKAAVLEMVRPDVQAV